MNMGAKQLTNLARVAAFAAAVTTAVPAAFAQGGTGQPGGTPRDDPKNERTVRGTVEKVSVLPPRFVQVDLKTEGKTLTVHVGPSWFLEKHMFALAQGDAIEVIGSKIALDGGEILIAREIKKGSETLVLRDAQGYPEWSRGRRP
jgi:hypothetical protein